MIEIKNLSKDFENNGTKFLALDNINLTIETGDIFGIIGLSGAGKSTLVRCINMLERPTEGTVLIDNVDMGSLSDKELRQKRKEITMIFQGFNLLMQQNCLDNVCFPLYISGVSKEEAEKRATELLEMVGLQDKKNSYPAQLSGGQQQRVAIARAMSSKPKVLLCDEATSALDPSTTFSILKLLKEINESLGITIVIITHQMSVVESICKNVAILHHGKVVETGKVKEVFARPKTEIAKALINGDEEKFELVPTFDNEHFVRLVYAGDNATRKALIARLALEENIEASIVSANTRTLSGETFGTVILSIVSDNEEFQRAIKFFEKDHDIIVEEVK